MGRHSSKPEVQAITDGYQNLGGYHVTRVLDPDDEFARTQWLSYGEVNTYPLEWRDSLGEYTVEFLDRGVANVVLAAYELGYEDCGDRVSAAPLGS